MKRPIGLPVTRVVSPSKKRGFCSALAAFRGGVRPCTRAAVDTTVRFLAVARHTRAAAGTAATEEPSRMSAAAHRTRRLAAALVCICSLVSCVSPREPRPDSDAAGLDAIVDDVIARYHLPGIAVGIVRDGHVIYMRTAGESVVGSKQPIDADTLFKIASNSKAMTAALLARLVDRGQLRWEDPVTRYLPDFKMSDPWVTREIQVRDLLIHNSGLREGAGDLMLWPEPNAYTRADILAGLAHSEAAAELSCAVCVRQSYVCRRR